MNGRMGEQGNKPRRFARTAFFAAPFALALLGYAALTLTGLSALSGAAGTNAGILDVIESKITNPPPVTQAELDWRMLAAQEAMASFAWWMFAATLATISITGVGTFVLLRQIRYTREALQHARVANEHAQEAMERQLRAYISIAMGISNMGNPKISLHNGGQTPAFNVYVIIRAELVDGEGGQRGDTVEIGEATNIPPGETFDILVRDRFDELHAAKEGVDEIFVSVECAYHDVFGQARETEAVYRDYHIGEWTLDHEGSKFT